MFILILDDIRGSFLLDGCSTHRAKIGNIIGAVFAQADMPTRKKNNLTGIRATDDAQLILSKICVPHSLPSFFPRSGKRLPQFVC